MAGLRLAPVALVALLWLAGCASTPETQIQSNPDTPTASSSRSETLDKPAVDPPPAILFDEARLEGTNCTGAGSSFSGPADLYAPPVPDEWQHSSLQGVTFINTIILSCNRVSWGALERPATLMIEAHTTFSPPDTCQAPGRAPYMIGRAWWSDVELGNKSISNGMPTAIANFARSTQTPADLQLDTFTWTLPNGVAARLDYADVPATANGAINFQTRLFWLESNQVKYMDLDHAFGFDQFASPAVTGEFSAETFYGSFGVSQYLGTGDVHSDVEFSASLGSFGDLLCETPG